MDKRMTFSGWETSIDSAQQSILQAPKNLKQLLKLESDG